MNTIHTSIEDITPERAEAYLACNTNNRRLRRAHVERLASDITADRWVFNGSTIVFNGDGTLLDGQHRLAAIVLANKPVTMTVVRGVSKSAMPTIDANVPRTAADAFTLNGVGYASRVAAGARLLIALRDGAYSTNRKTSNSELIEFLKRHPRLEEAAAMSDPVRLIIPSSVVVPWFYLARVVCRMEPEADAALSVLLTGVPAYPGDPIHVFRERVIKMPVVLKSHHKERISMLWSLIAAWNEFLTGGKATICRMRQSPVDMLGVNYSKL